MFEGQDLIKVNVQKFVESDNWLELCQYTEEEEKQLLEKYWRVKVDDGE